MHAFWIRQTYYTCMYVQCTSQKSTETSRHLHFFRCVRATTVSIAAAACFVLWIVLIPYQIWYGFAVICWWNWTKNGFTNRRMSADDSPWKHVLFRVAYVFCVQRMSQLVLRIPNSLVRPFTCMRLLSVFLFQFRFSLSQSWFRRSFSRQLAHSLAEFNPVHLFDDCIKSFLPFSGFPFRT